MNGREHQPLSLRVAPRLVGVVAEVGVVVMPVARDFAPEEWGAKVLLVHVAQLDLGKHQAFVIAVKLVHLDHVLPVAYEVARLLNAFATEGEELARIVEGDLLLPLEAADAPIQRGALDGEVALVASGAYAHRVAVAATDIALQDVVFGIGQGAVTIVGDEEFAFDFFHRSMRLLSRK